MGQSRTMSLVESVVNVVVGYGVATAANVVVLPLFGLPVTGGQAAAMGAVFTAISLVRSYILRRAFERLRWRPDPLADFMSDPQGEVVLVPRRRS